MNGKPPSIYLHLFEYVIRVAGSHRQHVPHYAHHSIYSTSLGATCVCIYLIMTIICPLASMVPLGKYIIGCLMQDEQSVVYAYVSRVSVMRQTEYVYIIIAHLKASTIL